MDIERWRNEIDELDEELLRLLNMRARLAVKVGALKRASGIPVRDPEREEFVLRRLREANTGPLDQEAVVRLFRRIIRESRRVEALAGEQVDTSVAQLHQSTKLRGIA
jgi:chorismate mutase